MRRGLIRRVGRIIGGSVGSFIDVIENATPETVMGEAIREIGNAMILLIVFLAGFGLIGLCAQRLLIDMTGALFSTMAAIVLSFAFTLPAVRGVGGVLAKIVPKDDLDAVSEESFIGRTACITLGTASQRNPAQGKLKDAYGRVHYVMIEPDIADERFDQGTTVLLVRKQGFFFRAIRDNSDALVN